MKVLLPALLVAAGYQAAVVAVLFWGWRNPRTRHGQDPAHLGMAFETVSIPTANHRRLHGWRIPAPSPGAPWVVLVHGWGRNVERMLPYAALLHSSGFNLLAFDARHHGSSDEDGFSSMLKFSEDLGAAVDFLAREGAGVPLEVGVLGLSVGGSAAIHASAHDGRVAAVATVGAFADPSDPRATLGPFWWLLAPGLPLAFRCVERRLGVPLRCLAPERHIGQARARFLLIHGERDEVIPLSHAHRLASSAKGTARLWVVPGRGHSDPHLDPAMAPTLTEFFRRALVPSDGEKGASPDAGAGLRETSTPKPS